VKLSGDVAQGFDQGWNVQSDIRKYRRPRYRLDDKEIVGNRLERRAPDSSGSGTNGRLCKHGTESSCSIT